MNKIDTQGLILLDEPENSLSCERQEELAEYIENSARFSGSQFIIASHSPFILSIKGAKVYDMDENPVCVKKWTEVDNVRRYYDFFNKHGKEFNV